METLLNAIAQTVGAILEKVGVVGKARRRAAIHAEMQLLAEMAAFPDLGPGTFAHQTLTNKIIIDIATLSGMDLRTSRRKIPWSSVVLALLLTLGFGYWTQAINDDGLVWYSVFPGMVSGLTAISILGMLTQMEEAAPADEGAVDAR